MLEAVYDRAVGVMRGAFEARIDTPPVLDMDRYYPGHRALEARLEALTAEAEALLARVGAIPRFHDISATQASISANDGKDWRLVILRSYGVEMTQNQRLLPALAAVLRDQPEVLSAAVSYLAPGKHIPPHRGPFKGILRYHLCLKAAGDAEHPCYLRLDDGRHDYRAGEALLWDDTFEHEVRNDTDDYRIALLLDIRRPALPAALALVSRLVIGVVATAVRLQKKRIIVVPG